MSFKGQDELKEILIQGSFSTFADVSLKILSMGNGVIIARILGPEGKGLYALLRTYIGLFALISVVGVNFAHVYLLSSEKITLEESISNAFLFTIIASILLFPVICWIAPTLGLRFRGLIWLMVVFSISNLHIAGILLGKEKIVLLKTLGIIAPAFNLFGFTLMAFNLITRDWVNLYMILFVSLLVSFWIYLKAIRNIAGRWVLPSVNARVIKQSLSYGVKNWIGNLFSQATYRFDYFLVQWFTSTKLLGLYSVAVAISEIPLFVPRSFSSILLPKFGRYSKHEAAAGAVTFIRYILYFAILISLIIGSIGKYLISFLYGLEFLASYRVLLILLIGTSLMSVNGVIFNFFAGRGMPHIPSLILGGAFVLNTILDIIFIPHWNIVGGAIASTVTYSAASFSALYLFKKYNRLGFKELLLPNKKDYLLIKKIFHKKA